MAHSRKVFIVGAVVVAAGIAITASTSGANFSGTSGQGTITGTNAIVKVAGSGGNGAAGMDIRFADPLVPGQAQSVTSTFTNTGNVNEDIYVVFNNAQALHAFDEQGRFAQASISVNGGSPIFASANLNDGLHTGATPAGPYNCSTATNAGDPQICPLGSSVLLLKNVAPNAANSWTFTYLENSSAESTHNVGNGAQGLPFNSYPVNPAGNLDSGSTFSGLPYQFYAVPAGQAGPAVPLSVS